MALADRSRLVKEVRRDKNGIARTVYVNPDSGHAAPEGERTKIRDEAHAALEHAIANPGKLSREHLDALPGYLHDLTKEQKKEVARKLKLHVSDSKSHLLNRLLAYAKGEKQPTRPGGPDTLYKAVLRHGGIDPQSLALKGHVSNVAEAIQTGLSLGLFRSRAGTAKDGKKGSGLDTLAQSFYQMGYTTDPDTGHLLDQLRMGAKSHYSSSQQDVKKLERKRAKEEKEAEEWARDNADAAAEYAAARERAQALRARLKAARELEKGEPVPFADETPTRPAAPNPVAAYTQTVNELEAAVEQMEAAKTAADVLDAIVKEIGSP